MSREGAQWPVACWKPLLVKDGIVAIADEDYLDWPLREPDRVVCRQRAMVLSVRETCEHVLRGDCLLAHPSRRRLNSHNEAAVVVHQVIVVITQPSRCAALVA